MKKVIGLFILSCLLNAESLNYKKYAVTINCGESKNEIDIYRLTLQKNFDSRWFESGLGYLSGYYELSANYWRAKNRDTNIGVALSPVFAYYFNLNSTSAKPYLEAGIGASIFSKTRIDNKNISTAYQFEDRVGVGLLTQNWNIETRYMHYSNANIKEPNDGMDIFILSLGKRF